MSPIAPLWNLLEGGLNVVAVPPAEAGNQRKVLVLRHLRGFEHVAYAWRVHRDRLLAEHMLVGFDRRAQVLRTESRRRRERTTSTPLSISFW